ncbi:MAG: acyl-CoA synthetase [Bdellovibrionota bacterium]
MADTFSLAHTLEAVTGALADQEAIVWRGRRLAYGELRSRSRRLANYLRSKGLGKIRKERKDLENWESGQDHIGLYLYNCNQYIEGMYGSYLSRTANFNVNYRYVGEELRYLLNDAKAKAIIYHASLAPTLRQVRKDVPSLEVLLQVADESKEPLLEGAVDYEKAIESVSDEKPACEPSPDDLYILYTGGTTGMPKGVLWRQEDIFFAAMGGTLQTGQKVASLQQMITVAKSMGKFARAIPVPPFMHGAAHWYAHMVLHGGGTIFLPDHTERMDPDEIWSLMEKEKVTTMLIVGDAFAVPLLDQLKKKTYDIKAFMALGSGGAILSPHYKEEFLKHFPRLVIRDAVGSSESGGQAVITSGMGQKVSGKFQMGAGSTVLSQDFSRELAPGDPESGWLARRGHIPLGYLNDPEKTRKTFPIIAGTRYSVPGDHAVYEADKTITLLGRGSVCINTGGEKVYPEEVEKILKLHPDVYDAVVVGTPHPKWGQQVSAVLVGRQGKRPSLDELSSHCAGHLAGYKVPRKIVWVDEMVRSPSGKADYRWASKTAQETA